MYLPLSRSHYSCARWFHRVPEYPGYRFCLHRALPVHPGTQLVGGKRHQQL